MVAAAAIIGILAVGAVGIQIDRTSVAQDCGWCQDFACLDVPYWTCNSTASAVQPTPNCGLVTFGNGTAALRCPQVCALATAQHHVVSGGTAALQCPSGVHLGRSQGECLGRLANNHGTCHFTLVAAWGAGGAFTMQGT